MRIELRFKFNSDQQYDAVSKLGLLRIKKIVPSNILGLKNSWKHYKYTTIQYTSDTQRQKLKSLFSNTLQAISW